jgi:hypothetical protein
MVMCVGARSAIRQEVNERLFVFAERNKPCPGLNG